MPNKTKYSQQKRNEVYELFWEGRDERKKKAHGFFTCTEIEKMTGVNSKSVWAIGRGYR